MSWDRDLHIPRQQLIDPIDWMLANAADHVPQVRLGVESAQLRAADQAVHRRRTLAL